MPLYEYQCAKDGVFEQMRRFSDPPLAACPTCGGPVEKLLSAPAIQFKGTGWYITDYARKGGGDAGKADKGESKESKDSAAKAGDGGSSSPATTSGGSTEKKP